MPELMLNIPLFSQQEEFMNFTFMVGLYTTWYLRKICCNFSANFKELERRDSDILGAVNQENEGLLGIYV